MPTATIFNSWDMATAALNGCDFDGDLVMLTDNNVLVNKLEVLPALACAQRRAVKRVPCEEDFIRSNIESFGNDIGQTTNWITSMFEVRSKYPKDSEEYKILSYRIRCGQLYQQNAIDKAKGIICKPMPRYWHDRHTANKIDDPVKRDMYRRIVADKKPYFMRYIYPNLMKQYNTYIKNTNKNALREFQLTVDELKQIPQDEMTERQREFLKYYELKMPVGTNDCVMNKICRMFEDAFDGFVSKHNTSSNFNYEIMKSDSEYTPRQYTSIKRLYDDYNKRLISYSVFADCERVDECDSYMTLSMMNEEFRKECSKVCPDSKALCNIILDICYSKSSTKRFAFDMCGSQIIENLLRNNDNTISFPVMDKDGELEYCGDRYTVVDLKMEVVE